MNKKPNATKITALILLLKPNELARFSEIKSGLIASIDTMIQNPTHNRVPISKRLLFLN